MKNNVIYLSTKNCDKSSKNSKCLSSLISSREAFTRMIHFAFLVDSPFLKTLIILVSHCDPFMFLILLYMLLVSCYRYFVTCFFLHVLSTCFMLSVSCSQYVFHVSCFMFLVQVLVTHSHFTIENKSKMLIYINRLFIAKNKL